MSTARSIFESIETKLKLATNKEFLNEIEKTGNRMITALRAGRKILIAGNGGSAADSQHFAAELAGKFICQRKGLPAIALTTNSSIITAIGNDFGFEYIFSRQVEGLGQPGDIFVGISTSGNSKNVLKAMAVAKEINMITVGLLGNGGGIIKNLCDNSLIVPSENTQNIQESHILIIHILCRMIDDSFKNYR